MYRYWDIWHHCRGMIWSILCSPTLNVWYKQISIISFTWALAWPSKMVSVVIIKAQLYTLPVCKYGSQQAESVHQATSPNNRRCQPKPRSKIHRFTVSFLTDNSLHQSECHLSLDTHPGGFLLHSAHKTVTSPQLGDICWTVSWLTEVRDSGYVVFTYTQLRSWF